MGFLHKLWDETLAGPTPDTGLGKLRKYNSFSGPRSAPPALDDQTPISRSITILRCTSFSPPDSGSLPSSPAGSSTPGSPFSPTTPRENFKKLSRRKSMNTHEPKSPQGYDWIVFSALDR